MGTRMRSLTASLWVLAVVLGASLAPARAWAQDFELEPINYAKREPKNRVSQLADALKSGDRTLRNEDSTGYLRSLLEALSVPASSQTLVFSKTSLQRHRISPRTPRALYFSDDAYVGYCQNGDVLEVAAVDPELGAVFYTLDQQLDRARLVRQTENCLICHGSSSTKGVPGFVVRSVYADESGQPVLASGTHRIDHTSPLRERWGGWYVSGTHGKQAHLGNLVVRGRQRPEEIDNTAGQNVTDLASRFDTKAYLTPHSDLVALMVLEHQADAHNYLTRANFAARQAAHYEQEMNRALKQPRTDRWPSALSRIHGAGDELVEYLLFCEEAPLTEPLQGTSTFAADFAGRGPRDSQGRSLRDLDLKTRLFKYPCSYLVYSPSFAALPAEMKEYVHRRLWDILSAKEAEKKFAHLSATDRQAIREILLETLPDLPAYWRAK